MTMNLVTVIRCLSLGTIVGMMAACSPHLVNGTYSPDGPALRDWVAAEKAKRGPPLDPLPVIQDFATFEYNSQGLRDPFVAAWRADSNNGVKPPDDGDRPKQPLELFPLDSLTMVGTIGQGAGMVGLVMGPDKVTYRVRPSDSYLGQNYGRATAVSETRIELVETVSDGAGGWMERPAALTLAD